MGKKSTRKILLDADVISHFIVTNEIFHLKNIVLPHELVVLDAVYNEAIKLPRRKVMIDNWISCNQITIMAFPQNDNNVKKEFFRIKKINPLIGEGERACMAVAKFDRNIIASSNFRDIVPYCKEYSIDYLGTLDILALALAKGIFDESRCNNFISSARSINNARFPIHVVNIKDYIPIDFSFLR